MDNNTNSPVQPPNLNPPPQQPVPPVQPPPPPITPPQTPAAAPLQPQPQEPSVPSGQAAPGGSKTLLVVALIVVTAAIGVGAYFFMSNQRTSEEAIGKSSYKQKAPTSDESIGGLEKDVNAIDVESNDADFADVDKDLQNL